MAKLSILVLFLALLAVQHGVLSQSSSSSDCSQTANCATLTKMLQQCNGEWGPPPDNASSGEYGFDSQQLATCMCTEQYYEQLGECLKCYQGQRRNIVPASRSVYISDCKRNGIFSPGVNPPPPPSNTTKIIIIAVVVSAVVLIIAAVIIWYFYTRRKHNQPDSQATPITTGGQPNPSPQPSPQPSYPSPTPEQPYMAQPHYIPQPTMYPPQGQLPFVGTPSYLPTPGDEVIPTPGSNPEQSGVQEYYPPPSHPPPASNSQTQYMGNVPAVYYASSMPVPVTDPSQAQAYGYSAIPPQGDVQAGNNQMPSVLQPGGRPLSDLNQQPSPPPS